MSVSQRENLVELPRERFGTLTRLVPDTPWTTTAIQAIRNRKASVLVDAVDDPKSLVVFVPGGDEPGDHDQAYLFGDADAECLRGFVAGVSRATEFVVDADLIPMVNETHPAATPREAICCWFEQLLAPEPAPEPAPSRRLRPSDAAAAQALIPHWAFRTFESPKEMILAGGCWGIEIDGKLASVAYVADQSIKYARIAVVTAEPYRRRGYGLTVARKLIEHVTNDGRLVCTLLPRRNAPAVHFGMKLAFQQKALLRTYKAMPGADAPAAAPAQSGEASPAATTSSSAHSHG